MNDATVLGNVPEHFKGNIRTPSQSEESLVKTSGIQWIPGEDQFTFQVNKPSVPKTLTKQVLPAYITKISDILGVLCPIIITAKLMLQAVGKLLLGWDEPLPSRICGKWTPFCMEQPLLSDIQVD
jgi:hypothetical protein